MSWNNPQNLGDYGTFGAFLLTLLTAFISAWRFITVRPFHIFETQKHAKETYLRKIEDDGKSLWVHADDWKEMKDRMDKSIENSNKWLELAQNGFFDKKS